MKKIIFAVEDEENIRELYKCALLDYDLHAFETGKELMEAISETSPDLIILDLMLPDTTGAELLAILKNDWRYGDIPVIIVSAKGDELSKVRLLNLGADDYLGKPFGIMELIARINANIRKSNKHTTSFRDIDIDDDRREIRVSGEKISFTLKEYELLRLLLSNANKTVDRGEILKKVWGAEFEGESRTLDMHIKAIRDKTTNSITEIATVRGVGFMLKSKE